MCKIKLKSLNVTRSNTGANKFKFLNKIENNFILSTPYFTKRNFTVTSDASSKQVLEECFSNPANTLLNYLCYSSEKLKKNYRWKFMFEQCGPDHQPTFTCTLCLSGPMCKEFTGSSRTKKGAQAKASEKALGYFYSVNLVDSLGRPSKLTKATSTSTILQLLRKEIPLFIPEDFVSRTEELKHQFDTELAPLLLNSKEVETDNSENEPLESPYFDLMTGNFYDALQCPDPARDEEMLSHLVLMEEKKKYFYHISSMREEILDAIRDNPVTIIEGGTGCGKSTQVPQMILDDWIKKGKGSECNVVVAQPRRLATLSVAHMVASERGEQLGKSVGYKMRLDEQFVVERGGIMFYTCGSLRELMKNNPNLEGVSHVIIDEVHERSIDNDFLLLLVKLALQRAKEESFSTFRLILMSATAKVDALNAYFNESSVVRVYSGRAFPVTTFYADQITEAMRQWDANLQVEVDTSRTEKRFKPTFIADVVRFIHKTKPEGAVLVFLPGWSDITAIEKILASDTDLWVLPLHSKLSREVQRKIFNPSSEGRRKVILATNIAETSITVEDVVYVVDTGLQNNTWYDPIKNISTFGPTWISKANVEQRIGRAGRVQPGEAFCLYDKKSYNQFEDFPRPEMRRLPLDWVVLRCKSLFGETDVRGLLEQVIEPPSSLAVKAAIEALVHLRMLRVEDTNEGNKECLTPIGRAVCNLSVRPALAKAMIYGLFFGYHPLTLNCLTLENKPEQIFTSQVSAGEFRHMKAMWDSKSDLLSICILLSKLELALHRCQLLEKDEWDLEIEELDRMVSVHGVKRLLDERDTDVIEPLDCLSWDRFEEFTRLKRFLQNQMRISLPKLHSSTFKQYPFDKFLEHYETEDAHYDLILSCLLSAAESIIREIIMDDGKQSLRVMENGKKLTLRPSSVLSRCTTDDVLYFSSQMYFWKVRNSFVTADLSELSHLAVALFYGQGLEQVQETKTETHETCLLRIKARDIAFITDKRTTSCLLDLRNMFQSILDYYVEPHYRHSSTECHEEIISNFTLTLKELIKEMMKKTGGPDGLLE